MSTTTSDGPPPTTTTIITNPSNGNFTLPIDTNLHGSNAIYILEEALGKGAFGVVYKAKAQACGCIKCILLRRSQTIPLRSGDGCALKVFRGEDLRG